MRSNAVAVPDWATRVSRRITIGAGSLTVIDGLFRDEDVASLFTFLKASSYRLVDYDATDSAHVRHWKADLPIAMAEGTPILRECAAITEEVASPARLRLERVQVNLELYGDMLFPHQDLEGGVTSVYYANPQWDRVWQGETVFCDDGGEPLHTVQPAAGRLVVFDADIIHRVGVPSRECYVPRISVAFKFSRA